MAAAATKRKYAQLEITDLYNRLFGSSSSLLILDLRTSAQHDALHINTAIGMDIALANLEGQHDLSCVNALARECLRQQRDKQRWVMRENVVLYEASGNASRLSPAVAVLVGFLEIDARCKSVCYLNGGFESWHANAQTSTWKGLSFPSEIVEDFLFLGGAESACDEVLSLLRIQNVICACAERDPDPIPGVRIKQLPLLDLAEYNITQHFVATSADSMMTPGRCGCESGLLAFVRDAARRSRTTVPSGNIADRSANSAHHSAAPAAIDWLDALGGGRQRLRTMLSPRSPRGAGGMCAWPVFSATDSDFRHSRDTIAQAHRSSRLRRCEKMCPRTAGSVSAAGHSQQCISGSERGCHASRTSTPGEAAR
eukprot:m51a1_g878 hypothetical protein (369) ;mRNA; f:881029-883640